MVMDAMRAPVVSNAPEMLDQPILPGWTFGNVVNVSSQNSTSPDTERDIVAEESYGRQLGRIIDALSDVIEERASSEQRTAAMEQLLKLREKVESIKSSSALRRWEQIKSDLAVVKRHDPVQFRRIAAELHDVLAHA